MTTAVPGILELFHLARGRYRTIHARVRTRNRYKGRPWIDERLWFESPERWRLENDAGLKHVQVGFRSWRVDPLDRGSTGVFDNLSWGADTYHQLLWDPNVLIPETTLESVEPAEIAGRPVSIVRGRPRWTSHDYIVGDSRADEYELGVDRERGVLLRLRTQLKGEERISEEVLEIEFDQDFPSELFAIPER